jgi:hypothetical protein
VRCADIVRTQHFPFRIEPAFVQAAEDNTESIPNKLGRVFHEDVLWSNLPNDP